ncbi:LysM peptidoglycan-binding domain-containing protein, partial [Bradyrhizobium sp.]|uniref:LysM peptidoglycan-binding domain-containing protein n=2 Tax=Bradyrhizobium sp. TaxID=376 RepID=UPI002386610B
PPAQAAVQGSTAIAAAGSNLAGIAAGLSGAPQAAGKDQSAPSFDIARIEANGDAVIAGRAAPGATVDLLRDGERLDRAVADPSGEFVMVPPRLPAGSYELTLSAKLPDGTARVSQHGAKVTVNDAQPGGGGAQARAADVAETASQPPSSSEPRSPGVKPQESAALEPTHAIHARSAKEEGTSAPAAGRAVSSKIVSHGDSLWRISRIIYGDGSRYALVYQANRGQIRNPNLIYPGQTLVLPRKGD